MKVLVTGGTGTISSGIVKKCQEDGIEVYAITRGNNNARNIKGVFNVVKLFGPYMEKQGYGSIINISSIVG